MESRVISRDRWAGYLQAASQTLEGNRVRLEVDSLEEGAQMHRPRVLRSIAFDAAADAVVIGYADGEHRILAPTEVASSGEGAGLDALAITDGDGAVHLLRVVALLGLPSA